MRKNINTFELPPVAEDPNAGSYIKAGLSSEAVYFLRAAFNQFDPDKAGTIDFREVVSAVFLKGMKFYDKEVYQLLRVFEQRPEGRINFKEFIQLLKYVELSYINLKDLANIKNDYEYLLSKPKETTLNIHALNIDVEKLGLSDKKLDKLKEAFSKIDLDKDAAIVLDDITKVIPPDGNSVNIENIKLFFDELDSENNGILTFNEIMLGMTTKKGILGIYNFLVFSKISLSAESPDNQQYQKDKFVTLDAYTNENVSDITVLDLVEAFELLDADYTLRIKSSVLKEHENRLQMILSAEEKKIYDELIKLNNDDIAFDLFIKWTIEEGFGSKDVVSVARKFSEYWAIVDRGNRLSFSETSQEKGYDYLNNIDKPKDKPARTSQDIHSLNHLKSAHPISITDIEPVQNFIMGAKRRSSLNTGIEGVTIQSLQRFSAVFGEGSIERPAIESSIYQVSLESLAEDEFETVKNFLNLKRQELSAGPNSIFRDDHFTQAENDFLKHENNKLREELAKKEELIISLREEIENKINQLNATKEVEKKLEDKVTELQDQLNKNSQNTDKIQQKLAAKVKELLLKDDTISHLEIVNKDKIKELENLQAEKTKSEQTLQDNFVNIKKKLDYVTQKFSEYLTQNTALQSEVHEKDDKIRKTEYALKQEKERSQGTITKLEAKITDLETKLGSKVQEVNKHALEIQLEIEHLKLELAEKEDYIEDLENMKDSLYQSEKDMEELKNKLIETQAHYNNSQSVIASLEKRLEVLVSEHNVWKKASLYKGEFELADYEQYFEDYMQKILNLEANTIVNGDTEESSIKTQEGIDRNYLQKLSLIEERLSFFQDKIVDRKRELMSFSNFPTSLIVDTQKLAFKQPNHAKQNMKEYNEIGKENPSAVSTASQMTKRLIEHEEEGTPHTALTANESLLSHQDFSDRVRMRNELDFQMKDPKQVGSVSKINENSQLQTTYFTTEGDEEGRIETEQSEESRQIKMNHLENERIAKIQQALSTYYERMSETFSKKMSELEEKLERFELVNAKGANVFKSFVDVKNKNIELERELEAVKREYDGQIKVVAQQEKMLIDLKKQKDKELAKQHKKFDQLLSKLTQEIVILKNGGLSDI